MDERYKYGNGTDDLADGLQVLNAGQEKPGAKPG